MSRNMSDGSESAPSRLFSEYERSDHSYMRRTETAFKFLDRSAWQDSGDIRRVLENAFSFIPDSEREHVRERFVSQDKGQHVGALLEVGLYAMLRAIAESVAFGPNINGLTPDFLVRFADTEVLMDVTTLAPELESNDSNSVQRILRQIEQIDLKGYFVEVYIEKLVDYDTPTTRLRRWVEEWIEGLESRGVRRGERVWDDGSWRIRFLAEKFAGVSNSENKIIDYSWGDQEGWSSTEEDETFKSRMRRKVQEKSDKYGSLDGTLVVAVTSRGTQGYMNSIPSAEMFFDTEWTRRKVSGVLFKPASNPWEMFGSDRVWELVHNPYANNPLEPGLFSFARECVRLSGEWISHEPAVDIRSLLGLPSNWARGSMCDE